MIFNSFTFLLFFPVVTALYFLVPHKFRWLLLLIASCYFYMFFKAIYILILFFTIIIDYTAGIYLEKVNDLKKKKLLLILSLTANIGVLAVFKYFNFFNANLSGLLYWMGYTNPIPFLQILLPIGLSFHTFQAMSYTIEVYRGHQKAERHFGIYALYVMFYPQLVAGPIERPQNLLPQFKTEHHFNALDVSEGLKRMLIGFFKKVVVADRLSLYVKTVFNNYPEHGSATIVLASLFFAVQIYCDFSGYSDIAIGSARVMGFKLMENFKRPYFAKSISEFWSRWHISLSTWFKDYVYIPLGGNRVSKGRLYLNLFAVFMISGLWHGANWTFIVWGALHGFYLICGMVTQKWRTATASKLGLGSGVFANFLNISFTIFLVTISWIFFRAVSLEQALGLLKGVFIYKPGFFIGEPSYFLYDLMAIAALFFYEVKQEYGLHSFRFLHNENWGIRMASYLGLVFIILLFGVFDGGQFIYFQF
ncbi:MBOAT family O-acyltransferase [Mucilaginibacter sp. P25]|uniref:D-alanyl-lipoteichoic acid acyltransferase DltB, MBOAT superfamily n=1 Tax=Mucilaginibacter gossypii TaxID=551996 RepID=A0A1G7NP46_9SPHI|nr:MBOAT family O-acyltransferase [Mucilaginibacter gossypii]SDF75721.1 D-alanyl-lipoteichoic acid acyltransferase DltB, MBOAT superfamily [Mucilaginibacter gossypii]